MELYLEIVKKKLLEVISLILLKVKHKEIINPCLYIKFTINYKNSFLSDYNKTNDSKDITIVLQNRFWDLEVKNNSFSVSLDFPDGIKRLTIPYESILCFSDPEQNFCLDFENEFNLFSNTSEFSEIQNPSPQTNKLIEVDLSVD